MKFTRQDLLTCHEKIKPHIHQTPIMTSSSLNNLFGAELVFKCENFQRTGSFKMRGATHAISCLDEAELERGVVAHSSGNFAQAVALAARQFGSRASIAMPSNTPKVKLESTRAFGGQVVISEPSAEDRERVAEQLLRDSGAVFLHPSNDDNVILGQGTAALELFAKHQDLDFLCVPVGGGGLIAGSSLAAHFFSDHCRTIGAEPAAADDAFRSLKSGMIEYNKSANTIADGLRTFLGDKNFPIIQQFVDKIILVTDEQIVDAMRLIWNRLKIIVEPSCAVPLAAIRNEKATFEEKKVGVILSGGNVDLDALPF